MPEVVLDIPTDLDRDRVAAALAAHDDWFYEFSFANGASTDPRDQFIRTTHETRAALVFPVLEREFASRWTEIECLDMACHQGWFAMQTALRGARRVHGVDVRPEHVERARLVAELAGLAGATFEQRNLFDLDRERDGVFALTLFLGILYHLEDPVGALKKARSLTGELCVIETQVARPAPSLTYLWGPDPEPRSGHAIAVGRVDEHHAAEGGAVTLVPTLDALLAMLEGVGFSTVEVAELSGGAAGDPARAQYVDGDRVVVFASV